MGLTKYLLLGLALLAALLGLWGWGEHQRAGRAAEQVKVQRDRADGLSAALDKATQQAAVQREVSLARAQELTRLRKQADATQKALNEALKANRDWADAPVPSSVLDALTGPDASPARSGLDPKRPGAAASR